MPSSHRLQICVTRYLFILMYAFSMLAHSNEGLRLNWEEAKAHYTFEIIKHTHWPNDDSINPIRIGILGDDEKINSAFQSLSPEIVRGKKIIVREIRHSTFNTSDYDVIFITERMRGISESLFERAHNTLLISDGNVDKSIQLYSLPQGHKALKITFNRDNLSQRGFEISINLLSFAGTKEDLSNHLHEQEDQLQILQSEVKEKESDLDTLNEVLAKNTIELNSAERLLTQSQINLNLSKIQLQQLLEDVQASEQKLLENAKDLHAQKKDINIKENEIIERERAIETLSSKIEVNRKILSEQNVKISEQLKLLEARQHVIGAQRNLLYTAFFIVGIFILLSYILLRLNHLRHTANQKLKKLNSQLYELATTDGLTGLFNRKHFMECAQTEFSHCQRSSTDSVLMMADIDYFKAVNDNHGHPVGDQVIKALADILQHDLRPYDIVGRLGGEEFAMMLIDCNLELAQEIAERLRERVAQHLIQIGSGQIQVSISIGLSRIKADDLQVQEALKRADKALYRAKDSGRNCVQVCAA